MKIIFHVFFDRKYKHGCLKGLNLQLSFDLNTQFLV